MEHLNLYRQEQECLADALALDLFVSSKGNLSCDNSVKFEWLLGFPFEVKVKIVESTATGFLARIGTNSLGLVMRTTIDQETLEIIIQAFLVEMPKLKKRLFPLKEYDPDGFKFYKAVGEATVKSFWKGQDDSTWESLFSRAEIRKLSKLRTKKAREEYWAEVTECPLT